MSKFKKILIELLLIIINNIIIGMLLGIIWYKLGFTKTKTGIQLGIDALSITFVSHKLLFILILFIIEFLLIIAAKNLFKTKKDCIIYYLISIIISSILLIKSNLGFVSGTNNIYNTSNIPWTIKETSIYLACTSLRYNSKLLSLNIPTLLGLLFINKKKKHVVK
ncbi:MAG: hypothetical protein VZS44_03690 [Bacilli bacterium]|nr:hypothetical protein [Bacilli bacterium]